MKPKDPRTSMAMARVRQKRTTPEECVASLLREIGVAYRRNVRSLPGSPDFANRRRKWVVQVHGCFWHQHTCARGSMPSHNGELWRAKFERNKERDVQAESALSGLGLRVLTVWECETKDRGRLAEKLTAHVL
ncbi:very short patch repair endonuclease [Pseudomonas sp. HMWF010]|nr:very short patch repair endonuclease [Caulobacter sp. HMWF009]PTT08965.1 very short patch repair endonuclease [Caulobacter sp. HMWF025]PTT77765.1 very short patch repair endonuclease [Pseudomonas sp. HMWF010]